MSVKQFVTFALLFAAVLVIPNAKAEQSRLTIGLIGDSTVADTYGWGPAFAKKVNNNVKVLNYAKNGATLDSLSNRLDDLLKRKPDFVLIQFGHNDMKRYDTGVYSEKLKDYIERVTRSGAQAVILSSVTRRNFDEHGRIAPRVIQGRTLPDYAGAAEAVAKDLQVPFVDLNAISIKHHNKIGPEASAAYNFHKTDTTHFSKKGADAISDLVINELKTAAPELAPYFK